MGLTTSFLTKLFGNTLQSLITDAKERKAFIEDTQKFLTKQELDTQLMLFGFAKDKDIKEDKEYLPMKDIYVPLRAKVPHRKRQEDFGAMEKMMTKLHDDEEGEIGIEELFRELNTQRGLTKALLTGEGGCGKSTFLKYIFHVFNCEKPQFKKVTLEGGKPIDTYLNMGNHYIPIFIRLRDLPKELEDFNQRNWKSRFSFINFFENKYGDSLFQDGFYRHLFSSGACLFLIDGLDEIAESQELSNGMTLKRSQVVDWLLNEIKVWERQSETTRFLLTGRPEVTFNTRLRGVFQVFRIQDFNKEEKQIFTEYWYRAYRKKQEHNKEDIPERAAIFEQRIAEIPARKQQFIKQVLQNQNLQSLLQKPLLLSLVLMNYSIDPMTFQKSIEEIYEEFISIMIFHWDEKREIRVFFEQLGLKEIDIRNVLGSIALSFARKNRYTLPLKAFIADAEMGIGAVFSEISDGEVHERTLKFLEVIENRTGVLKGTGKGVEAEREYEFYHRQFQDFLAADDVLYEGTEAFEGEFPFVEHLGSRDWWNFFEFLVKIKNRNSAGFFTNYLRNLEKGVVKTPNDSTSNPYLSNITHLVAYFLMANNNPKVRAHKRRLVKACTDLFLKTQSPKLIFELSLCLNQLKGFDAEQLLEVWQDTSGLSVKCLTP